MVLSKKVLNKIQPNTGIAAIKNCFWYDGAAVNILVARYLPF